MVVLLLAYLGCGGNDSQSGNDSQPNACGQGSVGTVPAAMASRHVFVIEEENHSYEQIVGNPQMPFLNSLLRRGAVASQYYSVTNGSLDSLMWLTAGEFVTDDPNASGQCFDVDNIVRSLLSAGMTWKSYNEGLPSAGDPVAAAGAYLRAHNPLSNYSDSCISTQAINSAPFAQFAADATGPMANFVYLDPDLKHDLHSGTYELGDAWLRNVAPTILARREFHAGGDGQLWFVFDEGELKGSNGGTVDDHRCSPTVAAGCGGRVLVAVIGPRVRTGKMSQSLYLQNNLLSTWARGLGIAAPNDAANCSPMSDLF